MNEVLGNLNALEKIYVVCSTVGGTLFMARLILQFIGGDVFGDTDGLDVDDIDVDDLHVDTDVSFKLLTFQGLTAFFMMFGLTGIALTRGSGAGALLSIIGALAAGFATVWVITKLFSLMMRFQSSGTIDNQAAVGKEGTVYLRIPAGGTGKINVNINNHIREYDAVSDDEEEIPTGDNVRVVRIVGGNVMVVQKY